MAHVNNNSIEPKLGFPRAGLPTPLTKLEQELRGGGHRKERPRQPIETSFGTATPRLPGERRPAPGEIARPN